MAFKLGLAHRKAPGPKIGHASFDGGLQAPSFGRAAPLFDRLTVRWWRGHHGAAVESAGKIQSSLGWSVCTGHEGCQLSEDRQIAFRRASIADQFGTATIRRMHYLTSLPSPNGNWIKRRYRRSGPADSDARRTSASVARLKPTSSAFVAVEHSAISAILTRMGGLSTGEGRAISILRELHAAEKELVGRAVVMTGGNAGTINHVYFDEVHGLRISISGHDGRWPISTVKFIQER